MLRLVSLPMLVMIGVASWYFKIADGVNRATVFEQRNDQVVRMQFKPPPPLSASLRQIVDECNRKVIADFKQGHLLAVAQSYADDATIYFSPGRKVRGREAIDRYWQGVKGAKDWKRKVLEVGGTREAIYEIGKSSLTTQIDGKESTYDCDYIVIRKQQQDGTYRTYADIFN
jgi:ketosteroid isomerase-like protein